MFVFESMGAKKGLSKCYRATSENACLRHIAWDLPLHNVF